MATDTLIHDYVKKTKRLLELELRSEEEQEQEEATTATKSSLNKNEKNEETGRASRIIRNLQVDEWRIGLMGRTVVDLIPMKGDVTQEKNDNAGILVSPGSSTGGSKGNDEHQQQLNEIKSKLKKKHDSNVIMLPAHKITVGDEVEIISKHHSNNNDSQSQQNNNNGRRKKTSGGVVSVVTESMISIALYGNNNNHNQSSTKPSSANDEQDDDDTQILGSPPLTIVPKSSIEVHKKMIHILHKLQSEGINHDIAGKIIQGVFDPSILNNDMDIVDNNESIVYTPFNPNLDESQINGIKFCLQDKPISLIHGPPGTGKIDK